MITINNERNNRKNINKFSNSLLEEQNNKCNCCGDELINIKYFLNFHIDHIIPLASLKKKNIYGTNDIENLQLLCSPCHKWKTKEFEKKDLVNIILNNRNYIDKNILIDKQLECYLLYHINKLESFNSINNIKKEDFFNTIKYVEIYDKLISNKFDINFRYNNFSIKYIDYIINLKCNFIHLWGYFAFYYEKTLNSFRNSINHNEIKYIKIYKSNQNKRKLEKVNIIIYPNSKYQKLC